MIRKEIRSGLLLLCLSLLAPSLHALEKIIELGKDAQWSDMRSMDGVATVPGRWGYKDIALVHGEYAPSDSTELLLHFDSASEDTGGWRYLQSAPMISTAASELGGASAAFTGVKRGIQIAAPEGSLFSPGAVWNDFTIEFWLYPATLATGETVLSWEGSTKDGKGKSAKLTGQSLVCSIIDRKCVWDFTNLFILPSGKRPTVSLAGGTQLIPRVWRHHLLHYDAREGTLEYLLDGAPEAIEHITETGHESGASGIVRVGREESGPLRLGAGLNGFLDELRVSRASVESPTLQRLPGRTGTAISAIIDLGFSGTRISRIEAVSSTPSDSSVELYYQVSDTWTSPKLLKGPTDWVPFQPPGDFKDSLHGRYIQLMVELFPDGTRTQSPRLSSLRVVYEPNLPPTPPSGLVAAPGNGSVTLSWRKVNDLDIKGYMVYYGLSPQNYLGTGASQGSSPIDAGNATQIQIQGLENGTLYYFAIVAYDDSNPMQRSQFSAEKSARPSRIYK